MTDPLLTQCTTGDCREPAVGEAFIDDDPKTAEWHPYCQDCIDSLFNADYRVRKLQPRSQSAPRSLVRMKAHTDPAGTAQRLIELQAERDLYLRALRVISDHPLSVKAAEAMRDIADEVLDA